MPIQLDILNQACTDKNVKVNSVYTPKFFDKHLTGNGNQSGLINKFINPSIIVSKPETQPYWLDKPKHHFTANDQTQYYIPIFFYPYHLYDVYKNDLCKNIEICLDEVPDYWQDITNTKQNTNPDIKIYANMWIHNVSYNERKNSQKNIIKTLDICYELQLWEYNNATKKARLESYYTTNPVQCVHNNLYQIFNQLFDTHKLQNYLRNYNTHDKMCQQNEIWTNSIDKIYEHIFNLVAKEHQNLLNSNCTHQAKKLLRALSNSIKYLETYNIPLDLYATIHQNLLNTFSYDKALCSTLCDNNLNLLLQTTLMSLNKNKQQLQRVPNPNPTQTTIAPNLSGEQNNAVTLNEPLIMVQAGAGTGKSTVVLQRIKYLQNCGVQPEDIMVLSFTNAAADNITNKNPKIKSMTIAKMIHTIYSSNFSHKLSSLPTIINSLEIYFGTDQFVMETFIPMLKALYKNEPGIFTSINNCVKNNYDKVIQVLNTIQQTTLELEIIICYQQIDTLKEPKHIQSRYLIVDEVQDNSVFEFIYTLKYVNKHKESLYIVGDAAQTLYEFRSSNPKALNMLEQSQVFEKRPLNINFRSNQEILDFANIALNDIETNKYAHLNLRANSKDNVTKQSFTDKVDLEYCRLNCMKDFDCQLETSFKYNIVPYINKCLARGEQVAFLAYSRHHVNQWEHLLKQAYPQHIIANLIPKRPYPIDIFSKFINRYWNEVKYVPPTALTDIICNSILSRLQNLVYNSKKSQPIISNVLIQWKMQNDNIIKNWCDQYKANMITYDTLLNNVKENMLNYEINRNAIKQSLLSNDNSKSKQQDIDNANFIISTIHSVKGLEFDNVVLLYKNTNNMTEENKRMYYVAFTRAINTEYIFAYDTVKNPKIQADYNMVIDNLKN